MISSVSFLHQRSVLLLGQLVGEELVGQKVGANASQVRLEPLRSQDSPRQSCVIRQVAELNLPCDLVGLTAYDIIRIGFVLGMGRAQHGGDDLLTEAYLTQIVSSHRGILDHVME